MGSDGPNPAPGDSSPSSQVYLHSFWFVELSLKLGASRVTVTFWQGDLLSQSISRCGWIMNLAFLGPLP